jgi:undecaprenyl-diphosphatase
MSFVEALLYGVLQGLTEFLPISSSGHLRVAPELFGWDDPGAAFTAVVQLGTMAAVLVYFRVDLLRIGCAWAASLTKPARRSELDARLGWYLIVATLPIGVLGLVFQDQIETTARDLRVVATTLIVFEVVLAIADRAPSKEKGLDQVSTRDGVLIGLAQSLALIPGVSRSGATISAGLFAGFTRAAAARFSFLLSVPAVVLSGLFQLRDITAPGGPGPAATIVATLAAFVTGYAAIAWLLRWLTDHTLIVFVVYRIALGTALWLLLSSGTIEPT